MGAVMKAGDKVIVRRTGVATYYSVNEVASVAENGHVVISGTEQKSVTFAPFDVVPYDAEVWARLQGFADEYADLRRRQLEAWAEVKMAGGAKT